MRGPDNRIGVIGRLGGATAMSLAILGCAAPRPVPTVESSKGPAIAYSGDLTPVNLLDCEKGPFSNGGIGKIIPRGRSIDFNIISRKGKRDESFSVSSPTSVVKASPGFEIEAPALTYVFGGKTKTQNGEDALSLNLLSEGVAVDLAISRELDHVTVDIDDAICAS